MPAGPCSSCSKNKVRAQFVMFDNDGNPCVSIQIKPFNMLVVEQSNPYLKYFGLAGVNECAIDYFLVFLMISVTAV